MYTPTQEELLITLLKGENVYEVKTGSIIKLDKSNIVESLYNFLESNDHMNDQYYINVYNYQLEIPIDAADQRKLIKQWKESGYVIYNCTFPLLDNSDENRTSGRTTRLIDYYIQELYNNPNKEIEIIDHSNIQQSNIHLTQMILNRLYNEHKGDHFKIVKTNVLLWKK